MSTVRCLDGVDALLPGIDIDTIITNKAFDPYVFLTGEPMRDIVIFVNCEITFKIKPLRSNREVSKGAFSQSNEC